MENITENTAENSAPTTPNTPSARGMAAASSVHIYRAATRALDLFTALGKVEFVASDLIGDHPKYKVSSAMCALSQYRKWGIVSVSAPGVYTVDLEKIRERIASCTTAAHSVPVATQRKSSKQQAHISPTTVYRRSDVFADSIAALKVKANQAVLAGALDMISSIESREDREKFAAEVKKLTDR